MSNRVLIVGIVAVVGWGLFLGGLFLILAVVNRPSGPRQSVPMIGKSQEEALAEFKEAMKRNEETYQKGMQKVREKSKAKWAELEQAKSDWREIEDEITRLEQGLRSKDQKHPAVVQFRAELERLRDENNERLKSRLDALSANR